MYLYPLAKREGSLDTGYLDYLDNGSSNKYEKKILIDIFFNL
jgi:hypothetical protein